MSEANATAVSVNADEIRYWNSPTTQAWVTLQDRIDVLFLPLTEVVLERAAPRAGERVLDIGCGCGATVLGLAGRVGPEGQVLGVDVSEPMIARARARIEEEGCSNAAVVLGDASLYPFETGSFDLAFSRFGVMFFSNPVEAFANIHRALKADGRLVFACFPGSRGEPLGDRHPGRRSRTWRRASLASLPAPRARSAGRTRPPHRPSRRRSARTPEALISELVV
jgi:SAM-dependent methyltransferase